MVGGALSFPCLYLTTGVSMMRDLNYAIAIAIYAIIICIWLKLVAPWIVGGESSLNKQIYFCFLGFFGYICISSDGVIDGARDLDPINHTLKFFSGVIAQMHILMVMIIFNNWFHWHHKITTHVSCFP